MRIKLSGLFGRDQDKALTFGTESLRFVKTQDFPVEESRWSIVVSPEGPFNA